MNELQDGRVGFSLWQGQGIYLPHDVPVGCVAHPIPYPMDTSGSVPYGKLGDRAVQVPSNVEVKNTWNQAFTVHYVCRTCCLLSTRVHLLSLCVI